VLVQPALSIAKYVAVGLKGHLETELDYCNCNLQSGSINSRRAPYCELHTIPARSRHTTPGRW